MTLAPEATLGDLRATLAVPEDEASRRLGIGTHALRALEATRLDRASVGTLRLYAQGLGGVLELAMPDGRRVRL